MPTADDDHLSRAQLRKRKLPYGFKAAAKLQSLRVRSAAGAGVHDRVCCFELADQLDIKIIRLSEMPESEYSHHLTHVEPNAMSAAIVRRRDRVGIWLNDSHSPARQQSNLAHELAHVILDHQDAPPLNETGCRELHAGVEAEADYFGSVLLVPEPAAVEVVRSGVPLVKAAEHFGVSEQMMRWRINDSGAHVRTGRERRRADGRHG
ncbi:MAG: ImmA/IrrE family metallo-endopeptidase [Acidimicrobiales bacterium]|nr:ImmA/IrrE family metallo-endopeptidase [Acidimicrobiales bacterium]